MFEKAHGDQPHTIDVDHIKPVIKGGNNTPSNLRGIGRSRNRSFPRTRTAGMK